MHLLACDFDGTIFRNGTISAQDIAAVREWRARGNAFGIVTGRGALTLLCELRKHALDYDFLLCNNGALLLDGQENEVARRPLGLELSRTILGHEVLAHSASCAVFDGKEMYVLEGGGDWLNPIYRPGVMSREEARTRSFVQISFGFGDRDVSLAWGGRLREDLASLAKVQCSLSVADVTAAPVGKASGIEWAAAIHGWQPERVLAVGDDGNDIEMLLHFNGYAMQEADASVRNAAGRTIASVADLLAEELA